MYTFERTAHYYETDQMGIVHHSNYIRWFEEARIELMNHVGLPYRQMEENGILIPVLGVTCRNYNGVRFEVVYTGRQKETGLLSCTGVSQHCFTTPALKPIRLKQHFPVWHEAFERAAAEA